MTIEKLKSGSYRISKMSGGKRYRITIDHKPTDKEAIILLANEIENNAVERKKSAHKGTMYEYAMKYIELKEKADLSPTTIRGYSNIIKHSPAWFTKMNIFEITEEIMKKAVKEYGKERSPKSVRLMHGFWHSIIAEYRPNFTYSIKLPPMQKKIEYEPTTKDVKRILEYAKGSRYSMLLQLASIGLRRGEAMVITSKDLNEDNVLTIDKDYVVDKNNVASIKNHPKTSASYRRIPISQSLADEIRENGFVYNGSPHAINRFLSKAQKDLDIPHFRLHMFRHFAAAFLHFNGYSDEQVMMWMGWDEPSTMAKVYRYCLDPEKSLKDIRITFDEM